MKTYKIMLKVELPDGFIESEVDTSLADLIFEFDGEVVDSKEYIQTEGLYDISLEVKLPDGFVESEIDTSIADLIYEFGGEVIDSKEYIEIK